VTVPPHWPRVMSACGGWPATARSKSARQGWRRSSGWPSAEASCTRWSTTAGAPTPATGAIVRVNRHGPPRDGRLGLDVPDRHDSRPGRSVLRLQPGVRLRRRARPDPAHPGL